MDINKLFRSFKQKLFCENILKALLAAFIFSAVAVFFTSFIYHIQIEETPLKLTCVIGSIVFVCSFLLTFIIRYPTPKKVATRMDEIGLQERTRTMLEYRNQDTEIAIIQRKDAAEHIKNITTKQMKFRFSKREFVACITCVCLAVFMIILPYNVFAFGEETSITNAEQEQIIKDLIEQLREEVKSSELDEELKESLNEIIDNLEEELKNTDSELEQAAKIEQAKKEMLELLEEALTKNKIGEALQKYELTRSLGEAISNGDSEKVTSALDALETKLTDDISLVATLSDHITSALSDSGVDDTDELFIALSDFATDLSSLDTQSDDFTDSLKESFDTAETAILAALEKQAVIEEAAEKLDDAMSDAKDEVLGNEKNDSSEEETGEEGESQEGEAPENENGEKPEGEAPEGETPEGEAPNGEMSEGTGEESGNTMTEGIYDPVSGSVTYGEVFAAYYADYLAALEAGEVPEDLQEIIDQYFSSLN